MHLSQSLVAAHVPEAHWQKIRLQMKGKPTRTKLEMLRLYLLEANQTVAERYHREVVCQNYMTALSRGGQIGKCALHASVLWQIDHVEIRR